MKAFNYFQPTEIRFGCGRIQEIGEVIARFGKRCLLATVSDPGMGAMFTRIRGYLEGAGVEVAHYDGVVPNPTTESVDAGAEMARQHRAEVILGVGGGSSMDTAKAIAVGATHPGSAWDYLFFKTQPGPQTLPVVAVSTTSGTGSQVTQVAVMTETRTRCKSAIFNPIIYPKVCIVDPELMLTLPEHVTASTGFDAFCHAFESYLHAHGSPMVDVMALEAIGLVRNNLSRVLEDGKDLEGRSAMAWADTLAGLCIANAGVTLPHGVGMAISGMYPKIMHGESLSIIYPAFMRFTFAAAVERFARVARIFEPALMNADDLTAAERSCELIEQFITAIGMRFGLEDFGAPESEVEELAKAGMVLPDYTNNPRVATAEEMLAMIRQSYPSAQKKMAGVR